MDEYSRAATLNDLKLLLQSLNEHGIEYLLIGGYALAAHGYHRATGNWRVSPSALPTLRAAGQ
ncbi:MAG: hypothetical protein FWG26_05005 [Betaproteobacteria bacterium]|nr:hypothetical protein [Betaproteobacteria bacterium]